MATLLELAQMSSASYNLAIIGSGLELKNDYWSIIDELTDEPSHYHGVAYRNTRTGEIVIANRGTDPISLKDLWSDLQLAAHQDFDAQRKAKAFALQVARDNPTATIIETGHSLGGNEAAAAYAELCKNGYGAHASAVTFQAPGISSDAAAGAGNDVLNIYNQGDLIRLAGGEHLGTSISIDAGPGMITTLLGVIAGATVAGRFAATLLGGKLVLDSAHSINTTVDYLTSHPTLGAMTHDQYQGLSGTIASSNILGYLYGDTNDVLKVSGPDGFSQTISTVTSSSGSTVSEDISNGDGMTVHTAVMLDGSSSLIGKTISKVDPNMGLSYDFNAIYTEGRTVQKEVLTQSEKFGDIHSVAHYQDDGALKDSSLTFSNETNGKVEYSYDAVTRIASLKTMDVNNHWTKYQTTYIPHPQKDGTVASTAWETSSGDRGVDSVLADGTQKYETKFSDGTLADIRQDADYGEQTISVVTRSGVRFECHATASGGFVLSVNGQVMSEELDNGYVDFGRSDNQVHCKIGEVGFSAHVDRSQNPGLIVDIVDGAERIELHYSKIIVTNYVRYQRYSGATSANPETVLSCEYAALDAGAAGQNTMNVDGWTTYVPASWSSPEIKNPSFYLSDDTLRKEGRLDFNSASGVWNLSLYGDKYPVNGCSDLSSDGSIFERIPVSDTLYRETRVYVDGSQLVRDVASKGAVDSSKSVWYAPDGAVFQEDQALIESNDGSMHMSSFDAASNTRSLRIYDTSGVLRSEEIASTNPVTGAVVTVVYCWNPEGSLKSQASSTKYADGSVAAKELNVSPNTDRITTTDARGQVTQIETIVNDPVSGVTTSDLKYLNQDGALQTETVRISRPDGSGTVTTYDGNGVIRQSEIVGVSLQFSQGTCIETRTFNADGTLCREKITDTGTDGNRMVKSFETGSGSSTTVTQFYEWGRLIHSITETVTNDQKTTNECVFDPEGTLLSECVSVEYPDGSYTSNAHYAGGAWNRVQRVCHEDGGYDQTWSSSDGTHGSSFARGDGSSGADYFAADGSGSSYVYDATLETYTARNRNTDGSTVATFSDYRGHVLSIISRDAGGHVTGKSIYSYDALTAYSVLDECLFRQDGSLKSEVITTISADGTNIILQRDMNGDGIFEGTETRFNHAPSAGLPVGHQHAMRDQPFMYVVAADAFFDVDADDSFGLSAKRTNGEALPSWLQFDAQTRTFTGKPTEADIGHLAIRLTAKDRAGASGSQDFMLSVADINSAPIVAIQINDLDVTQEATFSFIVPADAFVDADAGDLLVLSARQTNGNPLPAWLGFDAATRTFSGVPANADVGDVAIQLTATDTSGVSVSQAFFVRVSNVNDAPTVTGQVGNQRALEDAAFSYVVPMDAFTDIDVGDQLTLSARQTNGSPLPTWLGFDTATRTFSGVPANADVDDIAIQLTATDTSGVSVSQTFGLQVANVNDAPLLLQPLNDLTARDGTAFTARLPMGAFSDDDAGDVLSYSATRVDGTPLPAWLRFDAAKRMFSGTPGTTDLGSLKVRVTATDLEGLSASGDFAINVNPHENIFLVGSIASETLLGSSGNDTLIALGGNDILDGGLGADEMYGGFGDDIFYVDNPGDVVIEYFWQGKDTVKSTVSYRLGNDIENLTLLGNVAINGIGNGLPNVLTGNVAANILDGGSGADILIGGVGSDTYMFGRGYGSDTIQENDTSAGHNDIVKFLSGIAADQIWLRHVGSHLEASIIGTADKLVVQNWYSGKACQIEQFQTADGKILLNTQVEALVSAMASFAPMALGKTTLPADYQIALAEVIGTSWLMGSAMPSP